MNIHVIAAIRLTMNFQHCLGILRLGRMLLQAIVCQWCENFTNVIIEYKTLLIFMISDSIEFAY